MVQRLLSIFILLCPIFSFAQENTSPKPIVLSGSTNDLNAVAVTPIKFKRMAVAGWNNEILVYNTDTPYKLVQKLTGHTAQINALAYTLSGNMLASASSDMTVRIYDSMYRQIPIQEDLLNRHLTGVNTVVFDKSGKYLFSGDKEGKLMIWDIANKKPLKYYSTGNSINDLCLSPNIANIFVAHSDKQIKVLALAGGKIIRTLDGHTDVVNALALSPNNQYLISGSNDKTARIWDMKTFKQLHVLQVESWKVLSVAFTDDSKYCVTACNDGSIKIWDVQTGKLVTKLDYPEFNIKDIAFMKGNLQVVFAPKLKEGEVYGARLAPIVIPAYQPAPAPEKIVSPAQKSVDSIMAIRPLTKQDSVKYKSVLIPTQNAKPIKGTAENKGANNSNIPKDSAVVIKTPMNVQPKKK
ncbi:MAG: hypothetical protein CFE21_12380 [Bacteroidetes bacterium B1(2017)]|nr:MAG: hypothetical protein CFE21_12380 [Bacteroidetes bacterium B1(2017)]